MRIRRVLLALSMVVIIAACGDDDDGGSAATDAPAAGATDGTTAGADSGAALTIAGNAFSPKELTAPAGSIAITNEDGVTHTVTADDGTFDVSIDGGDDASITVETPGSYPFHCKIHSSMTGTLTIT